MIIKLGDYIRILHGYAFKTENYVEKSNYRLITLGNFQEGNNCFKYNDAKAAYYGSSFPDKFILKEGDLILPLTEQVEGLFGNSAFIPQETRFKFVLNQRVGKVDIVNENLDKYFLHYLLATSSVKNQLESRASGTKQRNISPDDIYDVTVDLPDISIQKRIGKILFEIEKKQENNSKINQNIEFIFKSLYDYWFLQFDFPNDEGKPYKSYCGKMVWNEELKREIPMNWEIKKLKDIVYLGNDKKYNGPNIKTIDMSVMPSNSISLNELNDSDNFETNLFKMKKYDILFGSIRPYLKKAGIAPCDGAFAGTVHCFRCYNDYDYNFALETLTSENMFDYACKNSKGSKMPVIGADRILEYPVPYNEEIVRKFNSFDFKKIIVSNIMQNQELASLRDFLLPLLMNGQVKFKD